MLEPQNHRDGVDREVPAPGKANAASQAPLTDREVPLTGGTALGATPEAIHAWLDGEGSESDARLADSRQVALWKMIGSETEQRARTTTPAWLEQRIMSALPDASPSASITAIRSAGKQVSLSPVMAAVAALGIFAVGFVFAKLIAG